MPRANRPVLPGHVWHITHRCHRQPFLGYLIDRPRLLMHAKYNDSENLNESHVDNHRGI